MSSISALLLGLMLSAGGVPVPGTSCPARDAGTRLMSVSVFDGHPDEHADLVPDSYRKAGRRGRSVWDVSYIYRDGRRVFVNCVYRKTNVLIAPVRPVKQCTYLSSTTQNALSCR